MSEIVLQVADYLEFTKIIPDESIDLIILDPPYNTTNQSWDKDDLVSGEFSKELYRVLKSTGSLYCWCGIGEKSQSLIRWFPIFSQDFYFKDLITWKKKRGIGMRRGWLYTREEIMWFVKNNSQFRWNKNAQYSEEPNQFLKGMSGTVVFPFKRLTNVWTDIPERLGRKSFNHYTPKPLQALERIIMAHTTEGDTVYDPFMGSGSTMIACRNLNRNGIGIDNNSEYVESVKTLLQG